MRVVRLTCVVRVVPVVRPYDAGRGSEIEAKSNNC